MTPTSFLSQLIANQNSVIDGFIASIINVILCCLSQSNMIFVIFVCEVEPGESQIDEKAAHLETKVRMHLAPST